MKTKADIRKAIELQRRALDPQWAAEASRQVADRIQTLEPFLSARTVGLYMAIGGEVDLASLFDLGRQGDTSICVPIFDCDNGCYEMASILPDIEWTEGRYGIREPIGAVPCPMEQIDLMIVPGTAFDLKGTRLGRGGGYYDRLLDGFSGTICGAAFDFQVLPAIPSEMHDRPVHYLVTETKIINVMQ